MPRRLLRRRLSEVIRPAKQPWPAPRWTYWAFVGLLFKFHASRVLKAYASLAERVAVRRRLCAPTAAMIARKAATKPMDV